MRQAVTSSNVGAGLASLRMMFASPPPSARPLTRWWWFGGAMTKEEITRELTFMRDAGIGGVELQPVYPVAVDDPVHGIHNVAYFSQEWFELVRHVARETARLELQFDLTLGSGWPYGGPFIPIEHSARRLRDLRKTAEGPVPLSFRDLAGELTEGDKVVCLVATPLAAAGKPDIQSSRVIATGERAGALAFSGHWQAPAGTWQVHLFVDSPTGQQVKRPTNGMEGYVVDHFSAASLHILLHALGDRTLAELSSFGPHPIHSAFCDSLEVYGADWTGSLLSEFSRLRGYDLSPYLPALWEDVGPLTRHVRYDFHLTLSDLILDNFFTPLAAWCEARGFTARVQAHGAMGDVLRAYGIVHIPEGENNGSAGDRYNVNLQHRRLASSSGHIYKRPLTSAETYTWLRDPLFLVTLEMMKAASDGMFLDGINHIVNHGYPSSPPAAGQPGWTFYASTVVNHNNTWWPHYHYLAQYIRRTAALIREGIAVNNVAVYLPLADVYAGHGCGGLNIDEELQRYLGLQLFIELRHAGYDFDVINDHALASVARVEGSRLRVGTAEYAVSIVPPCDLMPPESLDRLVEFVRSGGALIFLERAPDEAPGLTDAKARTARLREALQQLLGPAAAPHDQWWSHANGRVAVASTSERAVALIGGVVPPDFEILAAGAAAPADLDSARVNVGFVHRHLPDADVYFVSNLSNIARQLRVRFACGHQTPERWDAETGEAYDVLAFAHVTTGAREASELDLFLESHQSTFIVFRPSSTRSMLAASDIPRLLEVKKSRRVIQVLGRVYENREYNITTADGRTHRATMSSLPAAIPVVGTWTLRLGEAAPIQLAALQSWKDLPEGKAYSGWGMYETAFDFRGTTDVDWTLDLGAVHETAEAKLNGIALGAVWYGARVLPCRQALKAGRNVLKVRVANLWINKVANSPPWDRTLVAQTYGARWGEAENPIPNLLPASGLLGPVRLVASKEWAVRIRL
jgi:alpha-L-rhamnosidase